MRVRWGWCAQLTEHTECAGAASIQGVLVWGGAVKGVLLHTGCSTSQRTLSDAACESTHLAGCLVV